MFLISDELIEKIGRVVSKNIELPTYIEEFKATIKWTTSDENIISSIDELNVDDDVKIKLYNGYTLAHINKIVKEEK